MKVLISGGKGQLARSLLETVPDEVQVSAPDKTDFDLTSPDKMLAVIRGVQPDCIINTAAYTAVDKAESDSETAYVINAEGPRQLAELCAAAQVRLVQISTDYVFDGNTSRPWLPDDAAHPLGVYGASKAQGEAGIREHLPAATIVRTAWLYSRHGSNFVKTMLELIA
ncbi:MAG: SDR family oxidoreductase, partial [Candidatus Micrarchaeaceae archaeon]